MPYQAVNVSTLKPPISNLPRHHVIVVQRKSFNHNERVRFNPKLSYANSIYLSTTQNSRNRYSPIEEVLQKPGDTDPPPLPPDFELEVIAPSTLHFI